MPSMTPEARQAKVAEAILRLPALRAEAEAVSIEHGYDSAQALAAWELVEAEGATVHRQARLLAGKSRGG